MQIQNGCITCFKMQIWQNGYNIFNNIDRRRKEKGRKTNYLYEFLFEKFNRAENLIKSGIPLF